MADGPFCCRGCRGVYEMIHQEDLCRFYDLKPDAHAPAPLLRPESFDWLDRLLAEQRSRRRRRSLHLDLDIQGVHCAACVWLIEELFKRREAGIQLRINPTLGKVELSWDPARGDLKDFLAEVEKFGYRLGPSRKGGPRQSRGAADAHGHLHRHGPERDDVQPELLLRAGRGRAVHVLRLAEPGHGHGLAAGRRRRVPQGRRWPACGAACCTWTCPSPWAWSWPTPARSTAF